MMYALLVLLFLAYGTVPIFLAVGWIRGARREQDNSYLSLVSLTISTGSGLLAMGLVLYAKAIGGFRFFDPLLMRAFGVGFLLSFSAIILALLGLKQTSPIRWHALGSSIGMLLIWFIWMAGE